MESSVKILVYAGFLGRAEDFNPLFSTAELSFARDLVEVRAISEEPFETGATDWSAWVANAEAHLLKNRDPADPCLAIGYSLGGRLLLSLIDKNPNLFDAAVFLSVNPGLKLADEKQLRLKTDRAWALRFETEKWSSVVNDWNAQGVFENSRQEPDRSEAAFDRRQLSRILRDFSLAKQPDYRCMIRDWKRPQLWLAGERDPKFVSILKELEAGAPKDKGTMQFAIVPSASHRVFLDQPGSVAIQVRSFIESLASLLPG